MAKLYNGTDESPFQMIQKIDASCDEIILNSEIFISALIEVSFLEEMKKYGTESRVLSSKPEDQVTASPGCEKGCTNSALWNCGYNCGAAIYNCYTLPGSPACLNKAYSCATKFFYDCCYCAVYYKIPKVNCNYCK